MKKSITSKLLALIFIINISLGINCSASSHLNLWYNKPASNWNEALPVGNGRLGAMIFGDPCQEQIQLNEESIWTGQPQDADNPQALKYLPAVREHLLHGNYVEAQRLMTENMSCKKTAFTGEDGFDTDYGSYQTLGDLKLFFDHDGPIRNYYRVLNLKNACSYVSYSCDDINFHREIFSSAVHQVLVIRLVSSKANSLNFEAQLSRPECSEISFDGPDLIMQGQLYSEQGLQYAARMRILLDEGRQELDRDKKILRITNATSVTIILAAATNFKDVDFKATVKNELEEASKISYEDLKNEHVADYQKLFNRVELDLGKSDECIVALPTDERLALTNKKIDDPELITLYFQFGRYLLISSSRPGTLPANLQGIWADTIKTPWNGDYHFNINLQMNYWPAEITNLPECHEPLFHYIEALQEPGAKTARIHYGARGWMTHWTSNIWGFTSPGKHPLWGFFAGASGWLCRHLWDHYCFTNDKEFLKKAYPVMKGASEFYLDFLVEEPKHQWLVAGPSSSPENAFNTGWQMASICLGASLDQQIIWDLFKNTSKAAHVLEIDTDFSKELDRNRSRLAPPQLDKRGALYEWQEGLWPLEPGHRHMSHLFALCPGEQISLHKTPELAEGAKKSLEFRLHSGGGHTGWSQAWIINLWARLGEAALAYRGIKKLLKKSTLPNLFDNHPPFQIDGNFGGTAGIAEMLLQSDQDEIHILPALPDAWSNGSFKGLCARRAIEIDCKWKDKKLRRIVLKPKKSSSYKIRLPKGSLGLDITADFQWEQRDDYIVCTLEKNFEYQLNFKSLKDSSCIK